MLDMEPRLLKFDDVEQLMTLEQCKWSGNQLPTKETLAKRISAYPQLSAGFFCTRTSRALASLFLKPTQRDIIAKKPDWKTCCEIEVCSTAEPCDALFGISLTSINPFAGKMVFEFLLYHALGTGYKTVFLGSPIPGYAKAKSDEPDLSAEEYIQMRHPVKPDEPLDPQLNYYYRKGFKNIVSVVENYFPHENSKDFGVIMEFPITHHSRS